MPCMKCNSLIPSGTAASLHNGLMCLECLPQDDRTYMYTNITRGMSNWHYVDMNNLNVVDSLYHAYIIVDTVTPELLSRCSSSVYQVYALQSCTLENVDLSRTDYISFAPNTILKYCSGISCTLQIRGSITFDNCTLSSCYIPVLESPILITAVRTMCGYVRSLNPGVPHINLTMEQSVFCSDVSGVYYDRLVLNHVLSDSIEIPRQSQPMSLAVNNCKDVTIQANSTITDLLVGNSSVHFDNTSRTMNLIAQDSTVTMYEGKTAITQSLINSTIVYEAVKTCLICSRPLRNEETVKVKGSFVHAECMNRHSYSYGDFQRLGNKTKLPPFGFEVELYHGFSEYEVPQEYHDIVFDLLMHGFVRCSDSTVNDEMKSPILNSDKWLIDASDPLNKAASNYITEKCGTHIHVGMNTEIIRFFRGHTGIFEGMTELMDEYSDETEKIWGRSFNSYAVAKVDSERYSWLNLTTHKPTIEYRLPKMTSVDQFRRIVFFARLFSLKLADIYSHRHDLKRFSNYRAEKELVIFYDKFQALAMRGKIKNV